MTQDGSDKLKATKSRASAGKFPAKVNVNGKTTHSLTNWVVWATGSAAGTHSITENVVLSYTNIKGGYDFKHTIIPMEIVTDADRPFLSGSNGSNAPPDVPLGDTGVYNKGVSLAGGADKKWDSTRQIMQNLLNPDGLNFSNFPGSINFYTTYPNYPSDPTCGNDDLSTADLPSGEDNDPYNAAYIGAVYGPDEAGQPAPHAEGNLGDTFEIRCHFDAFARVLLGSKWYRISGGDPWRIHFKFKKQNESEAIWGLDFNGDGDTSDIVAIWRNDGSSIAQDNAGF